MGCPRYRPKPPGPKHPQGPGPSHRSGVERGTRGPLRPRTTARSLLADRSRDFTDERIPRAVSRPTTCRGHDGGGGEPAILSQGAGAARAARRSRPPRGAPRPAGARPRAPSPALPRPYEQLPTRTPRRPYPSRSSSVPAPWLPVPLRTAHAPLPKMAAGPPLKGLPARQGAGRAVGCAGWCCGEEEEGRGRHCPDTRTGLSGRSLQCKMIVGHRCTDTGSPRSRCSLLPVVLSSPTALQNA